MPKSFTRDANKVFAKQILGVIRDRIIGKRPMEMPDQIPADLAAAYQREEYKMLAERRSSISIRHPKNDRRKINR